MRVHGVYMYACSVVRPSAEFLVVCVGLCVLADGSWPKHCTGGRPSTVTAAASQESHALHTASHPPACDRSTRTPCTCRVASACEAPLASCVITPPWQRLSPIHTSRLHGEVAIGTPHAHPAPHIVAAVFVRVDRCRSVSVATTHPCGNMLSLGAHHGKEMCPYRVVVARVGACTRQL